MFSRKVCCLCASPLPLCVPRCGAVSMVAHLDLDRHALRKSVCPSLQYSFSLTTFSPSGKLVQIEYALNAVNAGATSLGIKASNGVVLATERKLPSILVDETTVSLRPRGGPHVHTSHLVP